jgi:hypothetical protein
MRRELKEIYKELQDDEWVTIYSIELKEDYLTPSVSGVKPRVTSTVAGSR